MILNTALDNLEVEQIASGNIVSHRPIFTSDSKNIIVVTSDRVLVYNTTSGFCTSSIYIPSLALDTIANVSIFSSKSKKNKKHAEDSLIICTSLGKLLYISISTGRVFRTRQINLTIPNWTPISNLINFICVKKNLFLILGYPQDSLRPVLYSVRPHFEDYLLEKICWDVVSTPHSVAVGCKDEEGNVTYYTAIIDDSSLFIFDLRSNQKIWHKVGTRNLICVTTHPNEQIIATGDNTGRIVLWRNFMDRRPAQTIFHWHTLTVMDICFTPEGTHLLSGGGECTLVKWDVNNSNNRRTLPRLGLPIRHVANSRDNSLIALSHADNSIQVIDSTNKIICNIQNITQCYIPEGQDSRFVAENIFQSGLHVDPNNGNLVMNGKPGHLQCYSFREDKHLYSLDITQQNYITAERNKDVPNSTITHVHFSKHGTWLVTGEGREENSKCTELRIKFWKFDKIRQKYVLNTSIDWPHEISLNALKIQPLEDDSNNSLLAISSGGDKRFKTWGIVQDSSIHGKSEWWNCENVGSYRDLSAGPISFSQDASVVGVAFSQILTLWTVEDHELKGTLTHSYLKEDIKLLEFGQNQSSHLIICTTKDNLIVWDVITYTLMWSVSIQVECLTIDALSNYVAIFSSKNHLYFFNPDNPKPLAKLKNVSKSQVISSTFVKNPEYYDLGDLKSTLVFVNLSQELCILLKNDDKKNKRKQNQLSIKNDGEDEKTTFGEMMPEKRVSEVDIRKNMAIKNIAGLPGANIIRDIMEASPHTMPSISFFADQLLKAVSIKKDPSTELADQEKVMEELKLTSKNEQDITDSTEDIIQVDQTTDNGNRAKLDNCVDLDLVFSEDISWIKNCITNLDFKND